VRNLADNAVRYAPRDARIRVTIHRDGSRQVLTVEDSGAAPPEADMRRLGERFFRILGTDEHGSGLGLSIVRRIAQLHGAEVRFSRSAMGGFCAQVGFAAAPAALPDASRGQADGAAAAPAAIGAC
jgi:two-component system sensor histidine kinase QseC